MDLRALFAARSARPEDRPLYDSEERPLFSLLRSSFLVLSSLLSIGVGDSFNFRMPGYCWKQSLTTRSGSFAPSSSISGTRSALGSGL